MCPLLRRVFDRARRTTWLPYRRYLRGCSLGYGVAATGRVNVRADGRIELGKMVTVFDGLIPATLDCGPNAEIIIGAHTLINYGDKIRARTSIRIGQRCMFAAFLDIDDSALDHETPKPIVIEDDVWIAHGATIRPGVHIGRGAVVAAGSVVASDVPAGMLAIGNPARIVSLDVVAHAGPAKKS